MRETLGRFNILPLIYTSVSDIGEASFESLRMVRILKLQDQYINIYFVYIYTILRMERIYNNR